MVDVVTKTWRVCVVENPFACCPESNPREPEAISCIE